MLDPWNPHEQALWLPAVGLQGRRHASADCPSPNRRAIVSDVIIVGAGLTGLKAARDCIAAGLSVQVLEARDRVGGRACSVSQEWKGEKTWFDFGAHFIGDEPYQASIWALVKDLGLKPFKQYDGPDTPPGPQGPFWSGQGANLQENASGGFDAYIGTTVPDVPGDQFYLQMMQDMVDQIPTAAPWSVPTAAALDALSVEDWVNSVNLPEFGPPSGYFKGLVAMLCRVGFSCEPREISMLWLLFYIGSSGGLARFQAIRWPLQGAQGYRLPQGAQSIAEAMVAELPPGTVKTGVKIKSCATLGNNTVYVYETEGNSYGGDVVLFAMAPALYADIAFDPPLPKARQQAAKAMGNSDMFMTFVRFDKAFWRDDTTTYQKGTVNGIPVYPGNPDPMFDGNISAYGLSGDVLMLDGPSVWMMDNASAEDAPALFAFIVGDQARSLRKKSATERKHAIIKRIGEVFKVDPAKYNPRYFEMDWNAEGFSKGCPAGHFGKGSFMSAGPEILLEGRGRQPVNNVFFASTETASISNGYMDGAIWSGTQIALAIQGTLAGNPPVIADDFLRERGMEACLKAITSALSAGNPFLASAYLDPKLKIHGPGGAALEGSFTGPAGAVDFFTQLGVLLSISTLNVESFSVDIEGNRGHALCSLSGAANLTGLPFQDLKATVMLRFTPASVPQVQIAEFWLIADSALIDLLALPGGNPVSDVLAAAFANGAQDSLGWPGQAGGALDRVILYGPGGTAVPQGPWFNIKGLDALQAAFTKVPDLTSTLQGASVDVSELTAVLTYRITGKSVSQGVPFDQPLLMIMRLGNEPGNPLAEIRYQTNSAALD
ncbi:MAG: FAD-binding protein [Rhodobacteraceae bacterium]|nr:MAG: FAD-binding protein [Paracoccaceae bacterium]